MSFSFSLPLLSPLSLSPTPLFVLYFTFSRFPSCWGMWERDPGANTNVDYSIYIPKRDLWPSERCSGSLARFFVHAFLVLFTGRVRDLFFFFVLLFLFLSDLSVCWFLSLSFLLFVFLCLGLFLSLVVLAFVKGVLFF